MKMITAIMLLSFLLVGCTNNQMAKNYGGTTEETLDPGKKLVNVTWKEDDMWFLVRDRKPGESVDNYQFTEKSSFGMLNGTVNIHEK